MPDLRLRRRRSSLVRAIVSCLLLVSVACSRDGFEDRTAVVEAGDRTVRYQVDSCGLDGSTLFVVGRSDQGEILQAVVELADDGSTGVAAASGFTADVGADLLASFGATAWSRRGGVGDPPGSVSWSRLRGARIQIAGEAEPLDEEGRQVASGSSTPAVRVEVDARCDQRDQAGSG
ncbi:MAG: hypothetical protein GX643_07680 [Acidimicrobiales bacterium]|mgnify:FL=1|nr:hypothetical protein [Acidimicrobiales bacterium]